MLCKDTYLDGLLKGQEGKCIWCGCEIWKDNITKEHLCPTSQGGRGRTGGDNIAIACKMCNRNRKSGSAVSFARSVEAEGKTPNWELLQKHFTDLSRSGVRREREYALKQLNHMNI